MMYVQGDRIWCAARFSSFGVDDYPFCFRVFYTLVVLLFSGSFLTQLASHTHIRKRGNQQRTTTSRTPHAQGGEEKEQTKKTAAALPVAISQLTTDTGENEEPNLRSRVCLVLPSRSMYTQGQNLEIFFAIAALPGSGVGQLHLIPLPQGLMYLF